MGHVVRGRIKCLAKSRSRFAAFIAYAAALGTESFLRSPPPLVGKTGRELSKKRNGASEKLENHVMGASRMTNLQDTWEDPAGMPDKKGKELWRRRKKDYEKGA
jgi:hypothetical protein